jgi:hypothetical protein
MQQWRTDNRLQASANWCIRGSWCYSNQLTAYEMQQLLGSLWWIKRWTDLSLIKIIWHIAFKTYMLFTFLFQRWTLESRPKYMHGCSRPVNCDSLINGLKILRNIVTSCQQRYKYIWKLVTKTVFQIWFAINIYTVIVSSDTNYPCALPVDLKEWPVPLRAWQIKLVRNKTVIVSLYLLSAELVIPIP